MLFYLPLTLTFLIGLASKINGTGTVMYLKFFLGEGLVVARGKPTGDGLSYEIADGQEILQIRLAKVDILSLISLHEMLLNYKLKGSYSVNTNYIMAVAASTAVMKLGEAVKILQWEKVLASNKLSFEDNVLTVRTCRTTALKCSLSAFGNDNHKNILRVTDDAHLLVSDDNKFRHNCKDVNARFKGNEIIVIEKESHTHNYKACIEALKIRRPVAGIVNKEDPAFIALDSELGDHDIRWWNTRRRIIIYSDYQFTAIRLAITPKRQVDIKFRLGRQPEGQSDIEGLAMHHDYLDQLYILPNDKYYTTTVGEEEEIEYEDFPLGLNEFEDNMKILILGTKIGSPESSEGDEPKGKRQKAEGWKTVIIQKVVQTGFPGVILNYN